MYSDERFCALCYENGLFRDGENYCIQCKTYLCRLCAQVHGENCRKKFHDKGKLDLIKRRTARRDYTRISDNGNKTCIGHQMEGTDVESFKSKGSTVSARNETPVSEERKSFSGQKSGGKRENYSARGGIVRVKKATPLKERGLLQRCYDHPEMNIENFCSTHNALCCEECMNANHRKCTVQPIDEIAHGIAKSGKVEKAVNVFKELKESIEEMKMKYERKMDEMQSFLNSMNKQSTENTNDNNQKTIVHTQSVNEDMSYMRKKISKCKELEENTSLCLSEIRNATESGSEILIFITLQKNQMTFTSVKRIFLELNQTNNVQATAAEKRKTYQSPENDEDRKTDAPEPYNNNLSKTYTGSGYCKPETNQNGHDAPLLNRTVIGDVILGIYDDHEMKRSSENENQEHNSESEPSDFYTVIKEHEDSDSEKKANDLIKPQTYEQPGNTNDEMAVTMSNHKPNKPHTSKKYVDFLSRPVASSTFRKPFKDRVISNGLVAEYYMNDDDNDISGGIRVLRLKSAPPERLPIRNTDASLRPQSINVLESRNMIKWQNRKLLESVEHTNEPCESNELKSNAQKSTDSSTRTLRRNKIFESSETELRDKMKTQQQDQKAKLKLLQRSRKDNARCPRKKSILSKKRPSESALKAKVKRYDTKTDAQRLQEWITQTEEMNRKYETEKAKLSSKTVRDNKKKLDEVDEVYAANVNDKPIDFNDDNDEKPTIMLMTKEATVIKIENPNDRQSSAKSRTSDSEEYLYNSQTYAHLPKTNLSLTAEQIVRLPEDERMCEVNSISCMPDGRIVVSDYSNKLIKMFRVGWGKASTLHLDEPPHGVSVVSNSILALISGLAYDRLLVVSVGQCLVIKRRFKTGCVCKAIASYESHIYLLCLYRYKTEVRILTTDGVVSIRLELGHAITSPQSIAVKPSNGVIYIVDKNRGILTVEVGRIVSRSNDKNIESYLGIDIDINNNVFVCTKNPCGIYELSYDGKHMMPIVLGYGVENVSAVAFNTASNSLIVACANSETFQIYKVDDTLSLKRR